MCRIFKPFLSSTLLRIAGARVAFPICLTFWLFVVGLPYLTNVNLARPCLLDERYLLL